MNPKYRLSHSILIYSSLLLATRAVYPRIKYTDRVCGNILRASNTIVSIDYKHYREIISAIRRYIIIDSRGFLIIFLEKWNWIISTCIILLQSVIRVVYSNGKYTDYVCSDILRMINTVFCWWISYTIIFRRVANLWA